MIINKRVTVFRWTKLRINMLPGTVLEPVSECFLASLIIGWAAHYVFRYTANHRAGACCRYYHLRQVEFPL